MRQTMASGLLVRAYRNVLLDGGRWRRTLSRLPMATRQLLEAPPAPEAWCGGGWLADVGEALQRTAGRAACRALGADVAREVAGGPMRPLVSMLLARFRTQLHGVYGRVGSVCNLLVRGPAFTFTPGGERDGLLEIVHGEPTPDAVYALWEGALLHTNHLCGVQGGVGRARLGERGTAGLVDVSW